MKIDFNIEKLDFAKTNGLIPAIVQHADSAQVLMLGYMNKEAILASYASERVTFYSRTRRCLWQKGETSSHYLHLHTMQVDCDYDSLLVHARPAGPVCHTGAQTCFNDDRPSMHFLPVLEDIIAKRKQSVKNDSQNKDENLQKSYTASLFKGSLARMAQKVGEEGVEVALSALGTDKADFLNENADLLFHMMVLLQAQDYTLNDVVRVLQKRHCQK